MKAELLPEDVMPRNSPLIEMFQVRHKYLWAEYHPIQILVNKRVNFSDPTDYDAVKVSAADMHVARKCFISNIILYLVDCGRYGIVTVLSW